MVPNDNKHVEIPAIGVHQWLIPEWDDMVFDEAHNRARPDPKFYLFSISAFLLKRLTGVYRRDPKLPPTEDLGIQRKHREDRSREILRYLRDGFPLSRIDRRKLVDQAEAKSLRMPGWLPTAVVINILRDDDKRGPKSRTVKSEDLVQISQESAKSMPFIRLPEHCRDKGWQPLIHPIEVIDGQHRLWAFEEPDEKDPNLWTDDFKRRLYDIEIPVVAFHGLDVTWQAYLFYTINQLPKRIDTSMVFDLYPLLRHQEWLLRFEGPNIYRETRAQDLTILLWQHPDSPWKDRIVRLGGREKGKVTQAAFLRSLMASFIKRWRAGATGRIGGLFGSPSGSHVTELPWDREQQAALLIYAWQQLRAAVIQTDINWTQQLMERYQSSKSVMEVLTHTKEEERDARDLLFSGPETLLATDQGVRGFLSVLNDILAVDYDDGALDLGEWNWVRKPEHDDEAAISDALATMKNFIPKTLARIDYLCRSLADFDWRLSSAVQVSDPQYHIQASYRGSGGYREIRRRLLDHVRAKNISLSPLAERIMGALRLNSEDEES